jgi:hypothetical protein
VDNDCLANDAWGEKISAGSKCIDGDFAPSTYARVQHGGCHEIECTDTNFVISIGTTNTITCLKTPEVSPEIYTFPEDDGNFFGTVTCPDYDKVCGDWAHCRNRCGGRGTCNAGGVCLCNSGWTGIDCSTKCHESCLTCSGPLATECASCGTNWTDGGDGTCSCGGLYVKNGGCVTTETGCPLGTALNDDSTSCGQT